MLGGTAWLFADTDLDGRLDYLFVDAAGQVSLADARAMATCARNVVLVGDPQQLGQVLQGTHPDDTEASVLEHLLAGHPTIPPDRGLFLESTFRLHPDVCSYISDEFYEGRLRPDPVTSTRTTPAQACASCPSSTTAPAKSRPLRPRRYASRSRGSSPRA